MSKKPRSVACAVVLSILALGTTALGQSRRDCPFGQRPSISGCVDGGARATVRTVAAKTESARTREAVPTPEVKFDLEPVSRQALKWARHSLLLQELSQLERMLRSTPRNAPDRPVIIRRLAEGYAELAAWSDRQRVEEELKAEAAERRDANRKAPTSLDTHPTASPKKTTTPRVRATTVL